MRFKSLALALIVSTSAFAADPMQVIIFAGGVTEADGAAALASFRKLEGVVAMAVKLPAGEPKVVDSSTLPGLKPGFRVVTLGVCKTPGPVLAALKAIYPGTYSKPLTGEAGPERCPTLTSMTAESVEPPVKAGTSVLNAFTITETSQDDRGHENVESTVGFVLVEKGTGLVRAVETMDGDSTQRSGDGPAGWEYESCSVGLTAEKAGYLFSRSCSDERTGCNLNESAIPTRWSETLRISVKGDALVVGNSKKSITSKTRCESGSYGD